MSTFNCTEVVKTEIFLLFKKMFLSLTTSHVSPELRTAAELLVNDKSAALSE